MKKKNLAIIMAAAMTMTALTGCGGGTENASTAAETTTAAAAATTQATETSEEKTEAKETESKETEAASAGSETTDEMKAAAYGDVEVLDLSGADPNGAVAKILAAGKITMGTSPDFAPLEFENIGASGVTEYAGADIELGKYIAKKMGVELEIKPMKFSAIQQGLISGTIDMGISGFAYTEERAEALGLSDFFNMDSESGQGLLVLADKVSEYNSAESFAGKKVAAQNASLQYNLVSSQLPEDVEIQLITAITDGVMMLNTGRVDAVAVSGDNGETLVKSYSGIGMAEFMFDYSSDGNVLGVQKGNDELLEVINTILAEVNEKGYYDVWREDAQALAESLGIQTN